MTKNILMGYDNPTGYKLEELLDILAREMDVKSCNISSSTLPFKDTTIEANNKIVELLRKAASIQRNTILAHQKHNKTT